MKLKYLFASSTILMALTLSACSSNKEAKSTSNEATTSKTTTSTTKEKQDLNKLTLPQLDSAVKEDESLIEMDTSKGKMKIKLFPKLAPKAVENFITHAKDGYYNGVTFHRILKDFMVQSGDPKGDGTGGESIWKKPFENEISKQLYHLNGALAMANAGADTNGSQFYIVENKENVSDGLLLDDYPEKIIEAYKKGGVPDLDGSYTVFGQVIEGMDVLEKIASVKTKTNPQGEPSVPEEKVTIETIKVLQEAKK